MAAPSETGHQRLDTFTGPRPLADARSAASKLPAAHKASAKAGAGRQAPAASACCRGHGHGLQKRLLRVRERKALRLGWRCCHTDTTDNIASATR